MKTISATEARQGFNEVINLAKNEPVTISKRDTGVAVIMSTNRYDELKRIEDLLYSKAAEMAIAEGFVSNQERDDLMNQI